MGTVVFQKEHIDRPDVYVLKLLYGLCPVKSEHQTVSLLIHSRTSPS